MGRGRLRRVCAWGDGIAGVTAMTMALTRRRMIEEPPSQLAIWARRLAVFSVVVAVIAIGIEQWGALEIIPMLVTFGAALALAVFAIVVAVAAFVMLWVNGGPGFGAAITGFIISLMLVGYPIYLGYLAYTLPAIKDITTDPIDPPRFEVVARLRPPNTSDYPGLVTAEMQKDAYPDVEPLLVKVTPAIAYDDAMKIIAKRKWRVFDARPPQPGREGHIEAIARSPIMGFRDDVVVRIRPARDGARIDARSASRYGYTDFGANAARVEALLDDIDDLAGIPERPKVVKPVKPDPKKTPQRGVAAKR
jgi:uncharacterized protein (DUF1499 family)